MVDASVKYEVKKGAPFLRYDWEGKPVILYEEFIESVCADTTVYKSYSTEIIVNDNPSKAEIFKYKLKQGS